MICVKCTDCGLLRQKTGSFKDMGILEGNTCPTCGGEVVLIDKEPGASTPKE